MGLVRRTAAGVIGVLAMTSAAAAHPHVWVTAAIDLVFNDQGQIAAVNHAWSFDPAYAEAAIDGLDVNGDGVYSPEELEPLTTDNMTALKDYDYFTVMRVKGERQAVGEPAETNQLYTDGRLTLYFQLPFKTPIDPRAGEVMLKLYDPEFFIDFQLAEVDPVTLVGTGPADCKLDVKPVPTTEELDQTREMLSTKGQDWKPDTAEDFGGMFARPVMYTCASS